jgi:site-specific DNA-methyltransferase (adenine-specific)
VRTERIGLATLHLGDCQEAMATMPDGAAEIAFTSPPYNLGEGMEDKGGLRVGHAGAKWSSRKLRDGYGEHDDAMPYDDYVAWQRGVLGDLWRVVAGAIYYNHKPRVVKRRVRLPSEIVNLPIRQEIVWDRGSGFNYMTGAYMPMHERILLLAKDEWELRDKAASGIGDVWRVPPVADPDHPCSFPVRLPTIALETSGAESLIDPFMGVGTAGVAACILRRRFIGVELNPAYFDIACKRIEDAQRQERLFA